MNEIDELINNLGIDISTTPVTIQQPSPHTEPQEEVTETVEESGNTEESIQLNDVDISDVLAENGFIEEIIQERVEPPQSEVSEAAELESELTTLENITYNDGQGHTITSDQSIVYGNYDGRSYIFGIRNLMRFIFMRLRFASASDEIRSQYHSILQETDINLIIDWLRAFEDSYPSEFNMIRSQGLVSTNVSNNTTTQVEQPEEESQEEEQTDENIIPSNSESLLVNETTSRFSGMEWFDVITNTRVILAGIGGIGSWTALQIARMNPERLALYDDDVVEAVNMSGQLYSERDIGMSKVDALGNKITLYTSCTNIYDVNARFTPSTPAGPIMICGFDNMEARKTFFRSWLNYVSNDCVNKKECLFIDGRLSIDTLQVFCITGDDEYNQERYRKDFLFSDSEAEETVCSMKQTTYLACMIGSVISNLFVNFCANLTNPVLPYDLPFFTQYDAQNFIFKTEN